jgi:uncharacterized protein
MVKEPRLGRVKTRLAREIGAVEATRFYRTVTTTIIRRLAPDPRWRTVLAVAPDAAVASTAWSVNVQRLAQRNGDIGKRMTRALTTPCGPWSKTVLIGSDIPGVMAEHVALAFRLLRRADVVFGPADDGGYWMVGVRQPLYARSLFKTVRWSSPYALSDTIANLDGRKAMLAARLSDVDDAAGYIAVNRRSGASNCR